MQSIRNRVKNIEKKKGINKKSFLVKMWTGGKDSGLWGHSIIPFTSENKVSCPMPLDEELYLMYNNWLTNGKRLRANSELKNCCFWEFLLHYCYLGSEEHREKRESIIDIFRLEGSEEVFKEMKLDLKPDKKTLTIEYLPF